MFKKYEYRKFELSLVKDKETGKASYWVLVSPGNMIMKKFEITDKKLIESYTHKKTKLTKNKYFSYFKPIPSQNKFKTKYEFQILDRENKIKLAAY